MLALSRWSSVSAEKEGRLGRVAEREVWDRSLFGEDETFRRRR